MPPRNYWRAAWVLLSMCCLLLLAACGEKAAFVPPPPPKVTVSRPVKKPVTDYLEFTGNTQAVNTVQLRARVEGYLDKVLFQDGDRVKKGQLLFLIQQNTYEDKLRQAKAEVLNQKAKLWHAKTELKRYSNLLKQKAASQTDVDQWQFNRDSAQAALMSAEASRDLAQLNLDYTRVTAPFNGRVDRRLRDPGNLVGSGESTVLAEVNQIDPIYVYFTINEKDLLRLMGETKEPPERAAREKKPVFLGLANEKGFPYRGHLDFAAISLTSSTGTLLLRGIFPNPQGMILAGLFGRVRVPVAREKTALLVPKVALGLDQQGPYVLVVNDKKIVERRAVTVGPEVDASRVIAEGLQGDEWVVVEGVIKAIPGRPVDPEKVEQQPPATRKHSRADLKSKKKAGS